MQSERINHKGADFEVFYFDNPMWHEDWHTAADEGLVYLLYMHHGPDYWDDQIAFVKEADKEIANDWRESVWW